MSACEKCWSDAQRARFGGDTRMTVVEHYYRLLGERAEKPCSASDQRFYAERPVEGHAEPAPAPSSEQTDTDKKGE